MSRNRSSSGMAGTGRREGGGWWVTIADKDLDAWNSLVLAESLRRTFTTKETCIIVTERVSSEMRKLVDDAFDYVTELTDDQIYNHDGKLQGKFPKEVLLMLHLWKCHTKNAVYIHPCSMVLKNCDELFELEQDFGALAIKLKSKEVFDPSLFVFKPNRATYNDMLSYLCKYSSTNGKTTVQQLLNSYFGGNNMYLEIRTNCIVGHENHLCNGLSTKFVTRKLGNEYNVFVGTEGDDFQKTRNMNMQHDAKIIHFAKETPWLLDEENTFVNLWKGICNDTLLNYESKLNHNNGKNGHKHFVELLLEDYNFPKVFPSIAQKPCLLSTLQQIKHLEDTISIIGLSCRFPGANNETEFWDLLFDGRDETKPLPPERYFTREIVQDVETPVGYLKCPIEDFDAKFFEISPREAEYMDPQQRLLLEVSWESLENAGINPQSLNGSNTAVFVGLWAQEYAMHLTNETGKSCAGQDFTHKYLGNAICASAARISHHLGLRGPSVAMEAGCASALEGVHYACASLKSHETDLAISCGVNVALGASGDLNALDSFILSPDGKCKTFDESANGFARGEACVVLILKRSLDAIRDGDKILGVIRGSALNSDGSGSTLGTPNAVAQELVLKSALKNSGLSPNDVSYIEAHGTGTPVGDPIEFHALNQVFSGQNRVQPLLVSSVKTNIGHTEGASGMSGLVKVLLCLRNKIIPRHLHLKNLNPYIKLDEIPAVIPSENTEWKPTSRLGLIAGVSSFGLSGTNVHVIVQEPPKLGMKFDVKLLNSEIERSNHIFVLSAKSEAALNELISKYILMLQSKTPELNLADLAYSANTGRGHFRHRLAVVAKNSDQLLRCLEKESYVSKKVGVAKSKIGFLFTGQGSQYICMAKGLYTSSPIFKSAFDNCAKILKIKCNLDLYKILAYNNDLLNSDYCEALNNSLFSQPAIFCVEICLAELWKSYGVIPEFVLGHSVGEFAAAVVAGILSFKDGLKLVVERSKLVNSLEKGAMMVMKTSQKTTEKLIKEFQASVAADNNIWIDIAAINSESEIVVSGAIKSIELFECFCAEKATNVGTQRLAATHAFHSRHMDLITKQYAEIAENVEISRPMNCKYISGTFAKEMTCLGFDSNYWVSHLRQPVQFEKAFSQLLAEGCNIFLEIGAQPILLGLGMASADPEAASEVIWCPSIRKSEDNWTTILSSLAKLYINGLEIDWTRFDAPYPRARISLPNYPFQREKFWFKGKSSRESNSIVINSKSVHPILGRRIPSPLSDSITYYNSISLESLPYVKDHRVADKSILPAAAYLELVFAAGLDVLSSGTKALVSLALENLVVESALELKDEVSVQLQTIVTSTSVENQLRYEVKVYKQASFDGTGSDGGKWKKLVSATFIPCVSTESSSSRAEFINFEELKSTLTLKENVDEIYDKIAEVGIKFGPLFKSIHAVWYSETEFLIETSLPEAIEQYICHPIVLDAMIQSCVASLAINEKELNGLYLPVLVKKCMSFPKKSSSSDSNSQKLYIHSHRSAGSAVTLYNETCQALAYMEGIDLVQTNVAAFCRLLASDIDEYPGFYEEVWHSRLGLRTRRLDPSYFHHPGLDVPEFTELLDGAKALTIKHENLKDRWDRLCYLYILRSIVQVGWNYRVGDVVIIPDFCTLGLILPKHLRLMTSWFDILESEGDVQISKTNPNELIVLKALGNVEEIEHQILQLKNSVPDANEHVEFRFTVNCGEQLSGMLQGKISPYSVLFPEDRSVAGALALYHGEQVKLIRELGGTLNALFIQEIVGQLKTDGKPTDFVYRILEVGAGSGSATETMIHKLNQLNISYEYIVTDISPLLLNEASKKLSDVKNIKFKVFDIEVDPKAQGFPPNYFDLVFADNVVHATQNLAESLGNIRQLLIPTGVIILTEQILPFRLMDISFIFMEGWWRFNDTLIRQKTPFVNSVIWLDLLESNGFRSPIEYRLYDECPYSIFMTFANPEEVGLSCIPPSQVKILEKRQVWVIFGIFEDEFTQELASMMKLAGKDVVCIYNSNQVKEEADQVKSVGDYIVNPVSPSEVQDLFETIKSECTVDGIIYLWGLSNYNFLTHSSSEAPDYEQILSEISGGLLHLVQTLANLDLKSNLYVVTKGAQYVTEQEPSNPISALLWGILLTFNNEFCNQYAIAIDIDPAEPCTSNSVQDVFNQLWLNEPEHQIVFRAGVKYVKRLVHVDNYKPPLLLPNADRFKLLKPPSGSFNDFAISATGACELHTGDVEIKVICSALNFKDVLLAMKPDDVNGAHELDLGINLNVAPSAKNALDLGMDFSGIIICIHDVGNSKFKVGDRVNGCISGGALASHIVVSEKTLQRIPDHMSFEKASTISVVYLTAIYFLNRIAKLNANDKVLIHAAAGGVGLAAIQIAQDIGAEIYATAGSKRKRAYLKSLGIQHVYNSRSTSYGREIQVDTNGQGVNVVLNALTGPNFKETTLSICASGARFLEMSKLNVWTKEDVAELRPDVFYFIQGSSGNVTELADLFTSEEEVELIRGLIVQGIESGQYKPLPYTRFPFSRVHDAFRYLQEAKHIGKVVVSMPETNFVAGRIEHKDQLFNSYSSYLITGGLGGIGMEVAKWMVSSGAKYIVLVGRNPPCPRAEGIISNLKANNNVHILVVSADVSDYLQCKAMFDKLEDSQTGFPRLKGIMHAAGVLSDGVLTSQSVESFMKVYKSKVVGTWNLHLLSQNYTLDHFVLFSSLVATFGGIGQANHSSANKYLDSFAKFRVAAGLPCISVNWGPWSDVGAAASVKNVEATFGFRMMSPTQGIESLQRALLSQRTNSVVFDLAGNRVLSQSYNAGAFLDLIKFQDGSKENLAQFEQQLKTIKEASTEEREEKIREFIEFIVRDTLRLPENEILDRDQDLREIGIDSLMAMELRSRMQHLLSDYDCRSLSIHELQENRTINKLARLITGVINSGISAKVLSPEELLELIKEDCILPEKITIHCNNDFPSRNASGYSAILLTGATGHLGPYILRDLLNHDKNLKIYCLIRAKSNEEAKERLENTLDNLDLLDCIELDSPTVVCLAGNLIDSKFGLSEETYSELLEHIDGIIHCAVCPNLALPYGKYGPDDIRSNNVMSLLNILKFAACGGKKVKPIQFASSIYALTSLDPNGLLPDEFPSDDDFGSGLRTGYHISKFVCEKLLKQAVERGLPVQVLRHHYLSGDSVTGLIPMRRNQLVMVLLTCQKIKLFPDIDSNITGVPIDIAASVSVQLFLNPSVQSGVYNINNPKTARVIELSALMTERGYEFQIVTYNKWREAALASQGLESAPLIELYVNDLFSSDQFTSHTLVQHALAENVNMFKNSEKLKRYVKNIDEMMISPLEIAKRHMDYYEKTFGKDNMNAFFEAAAGGKKKKE